MIAESKFGFSCGRPKLWFVTRWSAPNVTPPSVEKALKTSMFRLFAVSLRRSYQTTETVPPSPPTVTFGSNWSVVVPPPSWSGALQFAPPFVERLKKTSLLSVAPVGSLAHTAYRLPLFGPPVVSTESHA